MESVSLVRDRMEPAAAAAAGAAAKSSTLPLPKEQRPAAAAAAAPAKISEKSNNTTSEEDAGAAPAKKRGSDEKADGPEAKSPAGAKKRGSDEKAEGGEAKKRGSDEKADGGEAKKRGSDEKAEAKSPCRHLRAAGRKVSAERIEDAPPLPCTHLRPSKEVKSKFDFSVVCRKSRVAQLSAITVQMYVIHSEWDRIGNFHFLLLFVALATHGINTFMRWRDAIDGRFDLKQIFLCTSNNLRVQYALAVLSGPLLALFTYWFLIPQKISLVNATFYSIAAFIKMIFAVGCFVLEAMEVSRETLKPQVDYVKSFFQ